MPSVVTVHSKTKAQVAKHAKVNPHSKREVAKTPSKEPRSKDFFGGNCFRSDMPDMPQAIPSVKAWDRA